MADPQLQHLADMQSDDDENEDVCRICRCPGEPDNDLFYPCKCSGSIKYVHQSCLQAWLEHSGSTGHCEVCKHKFEFTPLYAKDTPTTLPWHELVFGLLKKAVQGVRLAHRVWVVSSVWLIVVPWLTCLAWRLAFVRGFHEVPRLLRERCNVLAVATDCIQGSLLSIGIVFLNVAVTSLKEQLKSAVASLEHQLLRDTTRQQAAAGQAAGPPAAAAAAAARVELPAADDVQDVAAPAELVAARAEAAEAALQLPEAEAGAPADAAAAVGAAPAARAAADDGTAAASGSGAADQPAVEQGAAAASSSSGSSSASSGGSQQQSAVASSQQQPPLAPPPPALQPLQQQEPQPPPLQQQQEAPQQPPEQQQQEQQQQHALDDGGAMPAAAAAAAAADLAELPELDELADHGREEADAWGDVPFEELLGLQGPWLNFLETIVLVIIGNAFFMLVAVYTPLNIGRLLLAAAKRACAAMTQEQQLLLQQALGRHARLPFARELSSAVLALLTSLPLTAEEAAAAAAAAAGAAAVAGVEAAAVAAGAAVNATAAGAANVSALATGAATAAAAGGAAAAAAGAMLHNVTSIGAAAFVAAVGSSTADPAAAEAAYPAAALLEAAEPLPLMPGLSFDQVLKELHAQLELPARADFVALSIGHSLLAALVLVALWLYASVRLWRAASRRVRRAGAGRRPLLVLRSTASWLLSAASLVAKGAKLLLLLLLELGAFPLAAGLWLDVCALPLTSASLEQRSELLARSPLIAGFMHWVLGVGFLLGLTFLVCVVREVLRPGALPFLRDPANPERNPIREMMQRPLLEHLARVALAWLAYAGVCVVLVHLPALLAQALVPSLYPLRVAMFDPLTQIPADMLLLHIFIPFTVEHVRVKGAVRAVVQWWLQWAGRLLGWSDYLLPSPEQPEAPAAAAAAAVAAVPQELEAAAQPQQQQQQERDPHTDGVARAGSHVHQSVTEQAVESLAAAAPEAGPSSSAQAAVGCSSAAAATPAAAAVELRRASNDNVAAAPAALDLQPAAAVGALTAAELETNSSGSQQQQQEVQPLQMQGGTGFGSLRLPLSGWLLQRQQQQQQHRPVQWYEQQPSYSRKLLLLGLGWLGTMVLLNCLLLTVPVGLGRALFQALALPWKNDLFTGAVGLLALWGGYSLAAGVAASANVRNMRSALAAAWRWLLLAMQCAVLLVLWLGVVATMLGMLCELVLLPLRLPPNQTALIYLYQDWTMGVLALKLWHLLVMVAPRRDGAAAPDTWQAHFDALQAGGLRNLDFHRALTKIVLPVLLNLATSLAVPYVVTRAVLPLLQLPASVLGYANLYAYQVYHGVYVAWLGGRRLHALAVQLHNAIRDDRYLVGRQLNNFELRQQQQREQEEREQQQRKQDGEQQQREQAEREQLDGQQQQQQSEAGAASTAAAVAVSSSTSSSSDTVGVMVATAEALAATV